MKRIKRLFLNRYAKGLYVLAILLLGIILFSNYYIISNSRKKIYSDISKIPYNAVGLVLGANKTARSGNTNLFFKYRIEAAAALFKAGKIKHVLVSGDNHIKEYDEATDMKNALIALGIPDTCISLDYAGFRTLDSVVRCKKIFGQDKFTIISQEFHNQRALFISSYYQCDAVAFSAKNVPGKYSKSTQLREYLAKFKALLDVYIFKTEPKFLGEKVTIKV